MHKHHAFNVWNIAISLRVYKHAFFCVGNAKLLRKEITSVYRLYRTKHTFAQ